MTLGQMMEDYRKLLDQKDDLQQQIKEINKTLDTLSSEILRQLEDTGVDHISSDTISMTRKVELMPRVKDKETFVKWCIDNGMTELLQKRCNQAPFRAYVNEYGEYPPGTEGYMLVRLNSRRL